MKKNSWLIVIVAIIIIVIISLMAYKAKNKSGSDDVIRIGALFPLTGNLANQGRNVANAFLLAGEDVNKSLNTNKYEMILCDTKADPKVAGLIVQQLTSSSHKPEMIFSLVSSAVLHIQPMTEKNDIVLFGFVGTDNLFDSSPKLTYRGMPSAGQIGAAAVDALDNVLKADDVLILYPNTAYGLGYGKAVEEACKDRRVKIFGSFSYEESTSGYANFITSVNAMRASSIFLTGAGDNLGIMLKVIRESGYDKPILCDLNLTPTIVKNSHAPLEKLYMIDYAVPHGKKYEIFSKEYESRFGKAPDPLATICYELFRIYDQAKQDIGDSVWHNAFNLESWHYESMFGKVTIRNQEIIIPLETKNVGTLGW